MIRFQNKKSLQTRGEFNVKIYFNDKEVGSAVYQIIDNILQLKWIEINEHEQGKGYGFAALDHIANMAIAEHVDFVIDAINDDLLNNFYYKWFRIWGEFKGADDEQIMEVFERSIIEDHNPKIVLKREELMFDESIAQVISP